MGQKAYESLGIRDWVECYKMCLLDLAWPWLLQTWAHVSCGDLQDLHMHVCASMYLHTRKHAHTQ